MNKKWDFVHKLSIIFLVISLITLTLLFINEFITEKRFNNLLNEVRAGMSNEDHINIELEVDGMIDKYHKNARLLPIQITHLSVFLDGDPESHSEYTANYSWGEQYQEFKRASFYYPKGDKGFIRVQSSTNKTQYIVTYIFFNIFILMATAYYINYLIYNKKQFSYRLFLQRGLISLISSLVLSLALSIYAGAIGYIIIYLVYSLPVFIIIGIPASFLINNWLKRINSSEKSNYFIGLGLYALFGFIGAYFCVMTISFTNEFYVSFLTDSLSFMNIGLVAAVIGYHILLLFKLIIKRKAS